MTRQSNWKFEDGHENVNEDGLIHVRSVLEHLYNEGYLVGTHEQLCNESK